MKRRPSVVVGPAGSCSALVLVLCSLWGCGSGMSQADAAPPTAYDVQVTGGVAADAGGMRLAELEEGAPSRPEPAPVTRNVKDDEYAKAPGDPPPKQAPPPPPPGEKGGKGLAPGPGPGGVIEDASRKQPILIYRAEFSLSVYEVQKSLDAVEGLAKAAGGYLSRRDNVSITIRVPAQDFQGVVDAIGKVGDVTHRNVVSEDITAEYRDLEVQLQNLIAMRARFEKLLEKAAKVEEALAIEQQLGRVTGEIERIKGRLKLLGDQARYSTITVRFEARSNQQMKQGPFVLPLPWLQGIGLRRLMTL